jgi:hypothetical protein
MNNRRNNRRAKKMGKMSKWYDLLVDATGEFMRLETTDGLIRQGKITGYRERLVIINGNEVPVPIEIEINNDPNDTVPLDRVAKIDIG